LLTILIGVMGAMYNCYAELPLSELGLDQCKVKYRILKIKGEKWTTRVEKPVCKLAMSKRMGSI